MQFRVGDIIIGNIKNDYSTTKTGTKWRVIGTYPKIGTKIKVERFNLAHREGGESSSFSVYEEFFDLVKRKETKSYYPPWF